MLRGTLTVFMSTSKTISLSEGAYEKLKDRKRADETFSDVVDRLAGERSLLEIVGIGEPGDGFDEGVSEARRSLNEGARETARRITGDDEE